MIKLIATALLEAFHALGRKDDFGYAFHCGEAGGIAAAAAAFGVRALELCDDISDAYEEADRGFMRCILEEMLERPGGNEGDDVRTRETNFHALEFGAILQVAMEAKREGDDLRYSLMIGFTTGLMFRCQDPDGDVERTVLAKILEGYRTDSYELLRQAHGTLGFVAQMRDLMSLMGKSEAARYYEERVRSLHWLRNFGLRDSRSRDYTIVIPNALLINFRLWQQGGENEEIPVVGDEVDYQAVEFFDEEDSVPFDDLDKSIAIDPEDVWERVSRAMRRQDEDNYEGAIAELTRALEIEPTDASLHLSLGWVRMTIADFSRVVQLDPNHAVAYVSRARVKTKQGDHAGAIIDYNRVLEIRPDIASVYSDRGSAKLLMRDYEGALADFERAKELDPKWVSAARDEIVVSKADRKPSPERDGFGIDAAMRKARSRMSGSSLTMP